MSTIIELIITFVLYFLVALAAALPLAIFHTRKMDKLISNYFHEIDESFAALDKSLNESRTARSQSLNEVGAQVDEMSESVDEIGESLDKIDKSFDKMDESLDSIDKSLDKIGESMDRTIEFKRLMRDYSDYKIKRLEARENFCESQFWNEKNIH